MSATLQDYEGIVGSQAFEEIRMLAGHVRHKSLQNINSTPVGGGVADGDPDIHVLLLPPFSDTEINALVRGSTMVFQKSIKEGFGLTVSEALWKGKPVVGGAVGGIKMQIINGVTGFLVHSPEGAANRAIELLSDPDLRQSLGENGRRHVRENFLITRHIKDYILLMLALDYPKEHIVRLNAF